MWASAIEVAVILVAAYVSDRIGRKPVLTIGLPSAAVAGCSLCVGVSRKGQKRGS